MQPSRVRSKPVLSVRPLVCALIWALGAAATPAAHAAPFEARVLLPGGAPASGWVISVVGQNVSAPCGPDGRLVLEPAPRTPFILVGSGPGGEVSAAVEVAELPAGLLEIVLEPVARDSVTVVSGIAPTLEELPASATTVVTVEEVEQRAPQRLYQVLESVAGVSKLGDGADSVPAIRGLGRGRTLILLDGARVSAERRAGPSATFVEPESLGSVEVLRGPGSVVYGSDAFGGVINAIPRDPDPGPFTLRYGAELGAGATDSQAAYASGSRDVGAGTLLLEGHWRTADDAEAGDGVPIYNSSLDSKGGAARYVHDVGPGRLRVSLAIDRMEDLGKAAIDSRVNRSVYPTERSDRLNASWLGSPGGGWESLEAAAFTGRYHIVLDRDRIPPATPNPRLETADTDARDASVRVVGARGLAGGRLQLGLDAHSRFDLHAISSRTDFAADGTTVVSSRRDVAIDDARQVATALFATWSRPLAPRLALGAGVRGDRIEARNSGGFFGDRSAQDSALSGNVALTFGPWSGWSTTAQVARGFRTPTLSDRYFRGPSGRGFVTGNPDLEPESSLQIDLASRWAAGETQLGLYAYHYQIDDLIERFGAGNDFFFRNRGEATIRGLELEAQSALGERWSWQVGAAWADGETDGGAEIDDIAAPNGWLTLRWAVEQGYAFGRVTSFLDHDEPGPTELERDGFTLVDLGGGWRISDAVELRLVVRNVADELYTASPDEAADRAVGRSFTFGASGKL